MRKIILFVFALAVACAAAAGVCSVRRTACRIDRDVNRALEATLRQLPADRVDPDTLRLYRSHITIADVRDTAYIAMKTVRREGRQETLLIAEAGCGLATMVAMSDWTLSGLMMAAALLWLAGGTVMAGRGGAAAPAGVLYGGLTWREDRQLFVMADGEPLALTPMQQQLMEMFFRASGHTLAKQEICDRLWPGKPDASDTLYTLIRRLRTIVEPRCNLQITSERGRAYSLTVRDNA